MRKALLEKLSNISTELAKSEDISERGYKLIDLMLRTVEDIAREEKIDLTSSTKHNLKTLDSCF